MGLRTNVLCNSFSYNRNKVTNPYVGTFMHLPFPKTAPTTDTDAFTCSASRIPLRLHPQLKEKQVISTPASRTSHLKDRLTIQQQTLGVQNDLVATVGQQTSDIPRRLEFSELQETLVGTNGFTDQFGGSGFTLSSNDDGLLSRGGESGHECPVVAFIKRTFS